KRLPPPNHNRSRGAIGLFFPAFPGWTRTKHKSAAIGSIRVASERVLAADHNARCSSIYNGGSYQSGLQQNGGEEEHSGKQHRCRTELFQVRLETAFQNIS